MADNNNFNSKFDSITTKFYVIYHNLLEFRNEKQYASMLSDFSDNIQIKDFCKILNVKNLVFNLKKEHMMFSFKVTLLIYVKSEIFNKLINVFGEENIDNHTNTYKTNITDISDLLYITSKLTKLKNDERYIESFKMLPSIVKTIDEGGTTKDKNTDNLVDSETNLEQIMYKSKSKAVDAWYYETKIEILNRFGYLRNYFGLTTLEGFKIKKVTYEEVFNMPYKNLSKYHNKIIDKIKRGVRKSKQLCNAYLEIEKNFVTTMISVNDLCKENQNNIFNSDELCNDSDDKKSVISIHESINNYHGTIETNNFYVSVEKNDSHIQINVLDHENEYDGCENIGEFSDSDNYSNCSNYTVDNNIEQSNSNVTDENYKLFSAIYTNPDHKS